MQNFDMKPLHNEVTDYDYLSLTHYWKDAFAEQGLSMEPVNQSYIL